MVHVGTADLTYQTEYIHDDRWKDMINCHTICLSLAVVAVTLRFFSQHIGKIVQKWA